MKSPEKPFFDNLKSSIEDLIDEEQLSIGRVGHPFTVPADYFSVLKAETLQSINFEFRQKRKVFPLSRVKIWYGAAAAFLLMAVIGTWFYNSSVQSSTLQNLSQDEILAYLDVEPISYSELSNSVEFTNEEIFSLTADNLPITEDLEFALDSPDFLIDEIEQLNEK